MSKLAETLKAAGWVETTLGECQMGEEVLLNQDGRFPRAVRVTQPAEWGGDKGAFVNTSDGSTRRGDAPVLRAPRPEYAPGTVALITWDEGDDHVRDLLPVRAMMSVEGVWHGAEIDPPGESDRIEVVRVLLPADQDTPPIEVTDEMAADALASLRIDANLYLLNDNWSHLEVVRDALKAALGVEK